MREYRCIAACNRISENKENLQADYREYRNLSQLRESSFAFVFLLDKVYDVIEHLYHGYHAI